MKKARNIPLLLLLIILSSISSIAYSETKSRKVIETTDLAFEGKRSAESNRPILLLISSEDCPYCVQIKRHILEPMNISGEYDDKIILRELMVDMFNEARDFDGRIKDASDIAEKYKTRVTPTLLFLGPKGNELTEKLVGINTLELFSFYVDQAIEKAIIKMRSNKAM